MCLRMKKRKLRPAWKRLQLWDIIVTVVQVGSYVAKAPNGSRWLPAFWRIQAFCSIAFVKVRREEKNLSGDGRSKHRINANARAIAHIDTGFFMVLRESSCVTVRHILSVYHGSNHVF